MDHRHKFARVRGIWAILVAFCCSTSWADSWPEYITDVMVVGGQSSSVGSSYYNSNGWIRVDKDLNAGAGGDYVYLLYKKSDRVDPDGEYITDFIVSTTNSYSITSGGRTYYRVDYDGDNHFKTYKGNLNSNTKQSSTDLWLYYTKANFSDDKRAVSGIYFNSSSSGAVSGMDLNAGAGGEYIYMHFSTTTKLNRPSSDPKMASGLTYNGSYQQLVATNASLWDGTMYYRLGSSEGSNITDIKNVKARDAGTYTVYYFAGPTNYANASSLHSQSVTISKSSNTGVSVNIGASYPYGSSFYPYTSGINLSTGSITYQYATSQYDSYSSTKPTSVGSYWVRAVIAGDNNCNQYTTSSKQFRILPLIQNMTIAAIPAQTYTGSAICPTISIKDGSKTLVKGTDYTVSCYNNVSASTNAYAYISGIGNYAGSLNKYFEISPKSVQGFELIYDEHSVYTGSAICPDVVVKDGQKTLVLGTDYSVECAGNVNVGDKATIGVFGKGNYTGSQYGPFTIDPKSIASESVAMTVTWEKEGSEYIPIVVVKDGEKTLQENIDYTVDVSVIEGYVNVVINGLGNYTESFQSNISEVHTVSVSEGLAISNAYTTIGTVKYYNPGETYTLTVSKANDIIDEITGVEAEILSDKKSATFTMLNKDVEVTATTSEVHTVSVPEGLAISDAYVIIGTTKYYKTGETYTLTVSNANDIIDEITGVEAEILSDRKSARFTMPSNDVEISATISEVHTVSVSQGLAISDAYTTISLTKYYKTGESYILTVINANDIIDEITGVDATIANDKRSATFTMPNKDVEITAMIFKIWGDGDGSEENPYTISRTLELDSLSKRVNAGNSYECKYFKLTKDIEFSHEGKWEGSLTNTDDLIENYTAIGTVKHGFMGIFDGNGKNIRGIRINKTSDNHQGLFGYLGGGAVVENVRLADVVILGYYYTGGIAGENKGEIRKCTVDSVLIKSIDKVYYHGGVVGLNDKGTVSGNTSSATLSSTNGEHYGGVVGLNTGTVSGNTSSATLSSTNGVNYGGVVGKNHGTVSDNTSSATLTSTDGDSYGGVVGYNNGTVSGNTSSATLTSTDGEHFGGVVGVNQGTVSGNTSFATLTSTDGKDFGGVVGGGYHGTVKENLAIGASISADSRYGAVVGFLFSEVSLINNYYYSCTVGDKVNATNVGVYSHDITENNGAVAISFTAPAAVENLAYNKLSQNLVTAGVVNYGTLLYSLDGESYGIEIPTAVDVKNYTVYYKVDSDKGILFDVQQIEVSIAPKSVQDIELAYDEHPIYTGSAICPDVVVKDGEKTLVQGTDYTFECESVTNVGEKGSIGIIGIGNYTGNQYGPIMIAPKSIASENVMVTANWEKQGAEYIPIIVVKDGEKTLELNTDYTVDVSVVEDYVNILVNGSGNYDESVKLNDSEVHTVGVPEGLAISDAYVTIGEVKYYKPGETYTLTVHKEDKIIDEITGVTATITSDRRSATFTMPNKNVEFSATISKIWGDGDGSKDHPYTIASASELDLLASAVNAGYKFKDTYFEVIENISYAYKGVEQENNYTAIGSFAIPFKGKFNGNGHTISGIRIYKPEAMYQGLFGCLGENAEVKNVKLTDVEINASSNTGGIVGINYGTISNSSVGKNVKIVSSGDRNYYYGGIAGSNDGCLAYKGTISGCSSYATLVSSGDGSYGFGGIVGGNIGTVSGCTSSATLTSLGSDSHYYGGIIGFCANGSVSNNLAKNVIVSAAYYYGAVNGGFSETIFSNNFYTACTIGGVENATNVGVNVTRFVNGYDITENNGAVAVSVTSPAAVENLVYNKSSQNLVTAGATNFGSLLYSLDGESYSTEIPSAVDANRYTVYYKVDSDNGSVIDPQTIEVPIAPKSVQGFELAYDEHPVYTGSAICPDVVVKDGEKTLVLGTDYTFECTNNVNVGDKATIGVFGIGNYTGSQYGPITIAPKSIASESIVTTATWKKDGSEYIPTVVVKDGKKILQENTDYTVEVSVIDGYVNAVINGFGNYTGTTYVKSKYMVDVEVVYFDENGKEQTKTFSGVALDGSETRLEAGVYIVDKDLVFDHTLYLDGDVSLILTDGATMSMGTVDNPIIYCIRGNNYSLNIYGQHLQSGKLSLYSSSAPGIMVLNLTIDGGNIDVTSNHIGISVSENTRINGGSIIVKSYYNAFELLGNLTINGGFVEASSDVTTGIHVANRLVINSGSVVLTGWRGLSTNGDFEINGGSVTARGSSTYGIMVLKNLFINGGQIESSGFNGAVTIAEGLYYTDGKGASFKGTLTSAEKKALAGKKIRSYVPAITFTDETVGKRVTINADYTEKVPLSVPDAVTVDNIEIKRNLLPLTPATIVLPVLLPEGTTFNAKFFTLKEVKQVGCSWNAVMQYIGSKNLPQPNTPYAVILNKGEEKLEFDLHGQQATVYTEKIADNWDATGKWAFKGVYEYKVWEEGNDEIGLAYGFAGSNEDGIARGEFGRIKAGAYAVPMRSYLKKRDADVRITGCAQGIRANGAAYGASFTNNEVIGVEFIDEDEQTTAIGRMDVKTGEIKIDRWFDIKGRKVNDVKRASKGAYYGKKVFKK